MSGLQAETLMVCGDCYQAIGSGDMTFLDYHYPDRTEADAREAEIWRAVEAFPGPLYGGDSDNSVEFSRASCECCGEWRAGSRHEVVHLYEAPYVLAYEGAQTLVVERVTERIVARYYSRRRAVARLERLNGK